MPTTYSVSVDGQRPRECRVSTLTKTIMPGGLCEVEIDGVAALCLIVEVGVGISVHRLTNVKLKTETPTHAATF